MSKSLGNTILLSDPLSEVVKKVRTAVTDTAKVRKHDPGNPDVCTVFAYHKRFTNAEEVKQIDADCRSGALGCVDCKTRCAASISEFLSPILERRAQLEQKPDDVKAILREGEARAKQVAEQTMSEVHKAMRLG